MIRGFKLSLGFQINILIGKISNLNELICPLTYNYERKQSFNGLMNDFRLFSYWWSSAYVLYFPLAYTDPPLP